ncbi:peptidylprolyl isomerase [Gloeocapsopsis dulcis]|uniref:peptidylprolyl isomerase n=1 Tax=Gloeocapsopsis dulcis AAB1 = 1H9 TaxID=1433147 RepID=A0A6N8FSH0_9CHRO|nr:peptidylprolyl isomerase [Gloeocapsopsis dulcis]MUL35789.1 peptidylprolyl isomerase [Gloeocapsopsis dulcis AAB1 = 1H9]WNN90927.1 peptidylprolyl isomerase [Gloeocapsopsis dulcis]
MSETLEIEQPVLPTISPATDAEIVTYLRRSYKFAEVATLAERDALILQLCEQCEITVSDEEWQAAGDAFRTEHKILGVAETYAWLAHQRVSVEDWSEGIKARLLAQKLKAYLFGEVVDSYYLQNREEYQRVALSQILVLDFTDAMKLAKALREEQGSFCALALEYSKGKQSQENGGFTGVRFLSELLPEIVQAIAAVKEGEIIGPIHTKLGYHILRVEKRFPPELSETVREQILDTLFEFWIQENSKARMLSE